MLMPWSPFVQNYKGKHTMTSDCRGGAVCDPMSMPCQAVIH